MGKNEARVIGDYKRDRTRCVCGISTRLDGCIALYSENTLYFSFEEREIVATFVEVLHEFIRTNQIGIV